MTTKQCRACRQHKRLDRFHVDRTMRDNRRAVCVACTNRTRREERAAAARAKTGICEPCASRRHGPACASVTGAVNCRCGCGVLGFRGPFRYGEPDPTAPGSLDQAGQVA